MLDKFGFHQRFELQAVSTKKSIKYKAEVWLNYQQQIKYRFLIESEGKHLYTSAIRETQVGYLIAEKWEPCFNYDFVVEKKIKIAVPKTEFATELNQVREKKTNASKPLFEPKFFVQIKSLLDDLL